MLEAAADLWEELILDDFDEIPAETPLRLKAIEDAAGEDLNLSLDEAIDDLILFVGCDEGLIDRNANAETRPAALLSGALGAEFQNALTERWRGADHEPWAIPIAFRCARAPHSGAEDVAEHVDILREAVSARNGWKRILRRVEPKLRSTDVNALEVFDRSTQQLDKATPSGLFE